jgi:hypothetical protein
VCVYGSCRGVDRDKKVSWLYNLNIPSMENGLVLGTLILSYHTKIEINLVETSMTCSCLMILLGN